MTIFRIVPQSGFYKWRVQYLAAKGGYFLPFELWENAQMNGQFGSELVRQGERSGVYNCIWEAEFHTEREAERKILDFIASEEKKTKEEIEAKKNAMEEAIRLRTIKPRIFP